MKHETIEKNVGLMAILIVLVIAVGGLVEIIPLMFQAQTVEAAPGVKPYPPLQLAGRDIFIREGCVGCHSQMVRTLASEVQRYGPYSTAGESVYDRPFLWGSKRTGPDLARVGGRYSNEWHTEHLIHPQSVVPESVMPSYQFLANTDLKIENVSGHLVANRRVGVPYTDDMIENAAADLADQANPDADWSGLEERYPKAVLGDFDGDPQRLTEMDALVAYLQMLGTLVDFSVYQPEENYR